MGASMKIDVFCHIVPPKYKSALDKTIGTVAMVDVLPTMYDMDARFRIMDKTEDLRQVLTVSLPPLETVPDRKKAVSLAKLANDEMAELVLKYPDRFAAAIASLPMNDIDAALRETDRAINDLKFKGVQIFTPMNDKPLDAPEFWPLYEKMAKYDLPILIHPHRESDYADYRTEKESLYSMNTLLGWIYETSAAMIRLTYSGVMEKYPGLKIITHHAGAMIPFLEQRVLDFADFGENLLRSHLKRNLDKPVVDYLKMFYVDTALYGNTPGLMCSYALYGAGHMLFATDFPYDTEFGLKHDRATIAAIEKMEISAAEKQMIFEGNARRLLHLPG
jgi:predicted TIM-barrel fold metal-dependent hydrolase